MCRPVWCRRSTAQARSYTAGNASRICWRSDPAWRRLGPCSLPADPLPCRRRRPARLRRLRARGSLVAATGNPGRDYTQAEDPEEAPRPRPPGGRPHAGRRQRVALRPGVIVAAEVRRRPRPVRRARARRSTRPDRRARHSRRAGRIRLRSTAARGHDAHRHLGRRVPRPGVTTPHRFFVSLPLAATLPLATQDSASAKTAWPSIRCPTSAAAPSIARRHSPATSACTSALLRYPKRVPVRGDIACRRCVLGGQRHRLRDRGPRLAGRHPGTGQHGLGRGLVGLHRAGGDAVSPRLATAAIVLAATVCAGAVGGQLIGGPDDSDAAKRKPSAAERKLQRNVVALEKVNRSALAAARSVQGLLAKPSPAGPPGPQGPPAKPACRASRVPAATTARLAQPRTRRRSRQGAADRRLGRVADLPRCPDGAHDQPPGASAERADRRRRALRRRLRRRHRRGRRPLSRLLRGPAGRAGQRLPVRRAFAELNVGSLEADSFTPAPDLGFTVVITTATPARLQPGSGSGGHGPTPRHEHPAPTSHPARRGGRRARRQLSRRARADRPDRRLRLGQRPGPGDERTG